jgi:hypothetical protein
VDELLAEIEAGGQPSEPDAAPADSATPGSSATPAILAGGSDVDAHRVHLPDGGVIVGTWQDIVEALCQIRSPGEPVAQFMRRLADEARVRAGVTVPAEDPRSLVLAGAQAGFWQIEY